MNPDLLPPTNTKPTPKTDKQPVQASNNSSENKTSDPKTNTSQNTTKFSLPKNLPKSVYLLVILVTTTIVLLTIALLLPKNNSSEKTAIQTDNIPEPEISVSFSQETKQTPFANEITTFKQNSNELDYNYPTYNLPIIETEINLSK